jgi:hypothetical protein
MVFYFTSNTVSPSAFIYVGKDKVESKALRALKAQPYPLTTRAALPFLQGYSMYTFGHGSMLSSICQIITNILDR